MELGDENNDYEKERKQTPGRKVALARQRHKKVHITPEGSQSAGPKVARRSPTTQALIRPRILLSSRFISVYAVPRPLYGAMVFGVYCRPTVLLVELEGSGIERIWWLWGAI